MSTETLPSRTPKGSRSTPAMVMGDLRLLTVRGLRRDSRMLDALLVSMALPVLIMATFVYVFGGAIDTGTSGLGYIDFVVPAVIVLCAGYGAATTAGTVAEDMTGGMIDRLRALPITDWAVPISYVVASLGRNVAATATALAAALALGFRPDATTSDWLLVLVVVGAYILAISTMAVVWGLLVRSVQAAGAFSFVVLFAPYLSDAFVPVETMPLALRAFAEHQPATSLVRTLRALLLDQPLGNAGALTAAWLLALIALSVPLAATLFRRRATS